MHNRGNEWRPTIPTAVCTVERKTKTVHYLYEVRKEYTYIADVCDIFRLRLTFRLAVGVGAQPSLRCETARQTAQLWLPSHQPAPRNK